MRYKIRYKPYSGIPQLIMRSYLLLITLLFTSQLVFAQKGLTGLWSGVLSNDSSTIRKDQGFEIALTQYKEKVYGYTRSSFIVNDTLFYIVKRVKGKVNGDVAEVTDDEIISHNFRGRVDKGVKVTYAFRMNQADSTWEIDGNWKTNKTKNFYSISGKAELKEEKNLDNSKIFPHLQELKLDKDVEFYAAAKAPAKKDTPAKEVAKPKKTETAEPKQKEKSEKDIAKAEKKPAKAEIKEEKKKEDKPKKEENKDLAKSQPPVKPENKSKEIVVVNNKQEEVKIIPVVKSTEERIRERVNAAPQVVNFKTDSLVLALYDNGEVDGDTVSVSLNGIVLMEKQGLRTIAIKKTVQVPADTDEMTLVLYAENLGKYPPNTGLLVVRDGADVYQVRFSADLTQNATIIFRRKR